MNIQYFHISWLNIFQAYEKEDEAPAAVPAEKKEKATEKVSNIHWLCLPL